MNPDWIEAIFAFLGLMFAARYLGNVISTCYQRVVDGQWPKGPAELEKLYRERAQRQEQVLGDQILSLRRIVDSNFEEHEQGLLKLAEEIQHIRK